MKKIIAISIMIALSACGYNRFEDPPALKPTDLRANTQISTLYEHYYGNNTTVVEDIIISGYVSATDKSGNFYNSFVIQDSSGAIEICAGLYYLHNTFRQGQQIVIKLKGLALGMYSGVLQLGLKVNPYSAYRVESFKSWTALNEFTFRGEGSQEVMPVVRSIRELNDADCGKIIRIENLSFVDSDTAEAAMWAYPATELPPKKTEYRKFCDPYGNEITVVTSIYADFAAEKIPAGDVALTGMLMRGRFEGSAEIYALKLRNINDVE